MNGSPVCQMVTNAIALVHGEGGAGEEAEVEEGEGEEEAQWEEYNQANQLQFRGIIPGSTLPATAPQLRMGCTPFPVPAPPHLSPLLLTRI